MYVIPEWPSYGLGSYVLWFWEMDTQCQSITCIWSIVTCLSSALTLLYMFTFINLNSNTRESHSVYHSFIICRNIIGSIARADVPDNVIYIWMYSAKPRVHLNCVHSCPLSASTIYVSGWYEIPKYIDRRAGESREWRTRRTNLHTNCLIAIYPMQPLNLHIIQ